MAELTHSQYDALERAIVAAQRIAVYRRGTEYVIIPQQLHIVAGREAIDAVHPTTGEWITLYIDDIDTLEVVR